MAPRRLLLGRRAFTLGGLALLSGCDLDSAKSADALLRRISSFNDAVQGLIFDPRKLAPTYPDSMMTRPFPFNAYYGLDDVPEIDPGTYALQVGGLVKDKRSWTLNALLALQQESQVTRLICIEGWSAIGKWGGVRLSEFLKRIDADLSARYVALRCADKYWTSIDMPTAMHAQTLLALTYDGQKLPPEYGAPVRLRMPTKLGYKNAKHVVAITVTHEFPGGYWENQGYNWFGGS